VQHFRVTGRLLPAGSGQPEQLQRPESCCNGLNPAATA
jgi:hypothetical protein